MVRISVLLSEDDESRFSAYCAERGFKKSTLVVRLIREHLDQQGFAAQRVLFAEEPKQAGEGHGDGRRKIHKGRVTVPRKTR
jgi:hypothetical protein